MHDGGRPVRLVAIATIAGSLILSGCTATSTGPLSRTTPESRALYDEIQQGAQDQLLAMYPGIVIPDVEIVR